MTSSEVSTSDERSVKLPMMTGAKLAAIVPSSFDEVARLARLTIKAGLFKPAYNEEGDEDKQLAQATMAIMQGLETGIPPMQAVQSIAVINGKCTIYGDLLPALIWANGHEIDEWIEGEGDNRVAHCRITRSGGKVIERTFSVADAKQARLWDTRERVTRKGRNGSSYETSNDGPWFRFPQRMLQMRARGFAARDGISDVLRGMYLREEIDEPQDRGASVEVVAEILPPPPPPPLKTGQTFGQPDETEDRIIWDDKQ
jgi:hypothetical protein